MNYSSFLFFSPPPHIPIRNTQWENKSAITKVFLLGFAASLTERPPGPLTLSGRQRPNHWQITIHLPGSFYSSLERGGESSLCRRHVDNCFIRKTLCESARNSSLAVRIKTPIFCFRALFLYICISSIVCRFESNRL